MKLHPDAELGAELLYLLHGDADELRQSLNLEEALSNCGFDAETVVEAYMTEDLIRSGGFESVIAASLGGDTTAFIEQYLVGDRPITGEELEIIAAFLHERRTRRPGRHSRPSATGFLKHLRLHSACRKYAQLMSDLGERRYGQGERVLQQVAEFYGFSADELRNTQRRSRAGKS